MPKNDKLKSDKPNIDRIAQERQGVPDPSETGQLQPG
jgi:hypothetical protein